MRPSPMRPAPILQPKEQASPREAAMGFEQGQQGQRGDRATRPFSARVPRPGEHGLPTRKRLVARLESLRNERNSYESHWKDLADHFLPRRPRFLTSDRNNGGKRNDKILNNTPLLAARVLAAGMMSGLTSPARQWFRLSTPDPRLAENPEVRGYLNTCEERMREVIARSNTYNCFQQVYADLGPLATAVLHVDEDDQKVIRCHVFPIGQYYLAQDSRGRVSTVFRVFSMTVEQVVEAFGLENVSTQVARLYEEEKLDEWVEVLHAVQPNRDRLAGRRDWRGMAFVSVWMELQAPQDSGFLRVAGYEEFPSMCPRWSTTGEDVYGSGPGMDALGDAKQLMFYEKKKALAAAKVIDPPMKGPPELASGVANLTPGSFTALSGPAGQTFEPALVVPPVALQLLGQEIHEYERRIDATFYRDLFMLLAESDRRQVTAEEIRAKQEEKMLQIGPVLERLNGELFDPYIDRVFAIMERRGLLPPAPEVAAGATIKVEYLNILAQAQKLLGTVAIERLVGFVGNLFAASPSALDKLNVDEAIDAFADAVGTKPDLVVDDETVAKLRAARAQQQQQAQAAEVAAQAAAGAKTLSETDMSGDTALSRLMSGYGGALGGVGGGA